MLNEGDQLGRYTIRRLLGKGGWGEVYEARDPDLERLVAIKLVPVEHAVDPEVRERFEREARAVAGLDHPNIVTLHSVEEDNGRRFITMQLVQGRTLTELIPENGLELDEFFRIALPLVEAVTAAHAKGITHRDLKPGNVMVTEDGQVKVLDFGLAKLLPTDDGATLISGSQTATGAVLGTLNYMSPEQLRAEEVDHRSDIFALGILLYEMATGRVPFKGSSSLEVAASILRDQPSTIARFREGLPAELDRILKTCLDDDPGKRYQSAADLRNDLGRLRQDVGADETQAWPVAKLAPARRVRRPLVIGLALVVALAVAGSFLLGRNGGAPVTPPRAAPEASSAQRIVVLPFEDLGPPAVEFFATGLTEEISSRLAGVDGLGVISRISADQYAGTTKTAREIGDELGVAYILQGRVLWGSGGGTAGRVKIAPKLIRVADDIEIWGEPYERSTGDIFDIQSEIATSVAGQLGRRLVGGPGVGGEEKRTASVEAYQAYLRGLHYARRPIYTLGNWNQAVRGFREAVDADPGFAAAWGWLARSHAFVYHLRLDRTEERRRLAREALDRAIELAPDALETRLAAGYFYYEVVQDYERALEEFGFLEERLPNHYEVHEAKGYVLRRRGLWEEAQTSLERAFDLNPRDAALAGEIAESYANNRDYPTALRWLDQSIALDPDQVYAYMSKAWVLLLRNGDLDAARATLMRMQRTDDTLAAWARFWLEMFDGRPRQALERLPPELGDWIQSREWPQSVALLRGQAYELLGEADAARESYLAAAELLRAELDRVPTDAHHHSALGLTYAGLGEAEQAIEHGRRAVELQPVSKDAFSGTYYLSDLALIYARTGRTERALDLLEQLIGQPAIISPSMLRLDPRWAGLAGEPRFEELTKG